MGQVVGGCIAYRKKKGKWWASGIDEGSYGGLETKIARAETTLEIWNTPSTLARFRSLAGVLKSGFEIVDECVKTRSAAWIFVALTLEPCA